MQSKKKGTRSPVYNVLTRSLSIGVGEGFKVKVGSWEGGWYGQKRSEKVEKMATAYDELMVHYTKIESELVALKSKSPRHASALDSRAIEINNSISEIEKMEVTNDEEARKVALEKILAVGVQAKELKEEIETTNGKAPATIKYTPIADVTSVTKLTVYTLAATCTSGAPVQIFRKGSAWTEKTLNPGPSQALELRAPATETFLDATEVLYVDVTAPVRAITWKPPTEIELNLAVTLGSLGVVATGDGDPPTITAPAKGTFATLGKAQPLTVVAMGKEPWQRGTAQTAVDVFAKRVITWTPRTELIRGAKLTLGAMSASATGEGGLPEFEPKDALFEKTGTFLLKIIAKGKGDWREDSKEVTVTVLDPKRAITWKPPKEIELGKALSLTDVGASATGNGGALTLDPSAAFTAVGPATLKILAPGKDGWRDGEATSPIVVFAHRVITWSPPVEVSLGEKFSLTELRASATGLGPAPTLDPPEGIFASLGAQTLTIRAVGTDGWRDATPLLQPVTVLEPKRVISWYPPDKVSRGLALDPVKDLSASTSDGGVGFTLEPANGVFTKNGKNKLTIVAPAIPGWRESRETMDVTVVDPTRIITWTPPTEVEIGQALALTASATGEGGALYFDPPQGLFTETGTKTLTLHAPVQEGSGWQKGAATVTVTVFGLRKVTWTKPTEVVGGVPIESSTLAASATGPGGAFALVPTDGIFTKLGDSEDLEIRFPGSNGWRDGSEKTKVKVTARPRAITWTLPGTVGFGVVVTPLLLKVKRQRGKGAFTITEPKGGEFAKVGEKVKVSVALAADGVDAAATVAGEVIVAKGKVTLSWKPKAILLGAALGADQLNASIDEKGITGATIEYQPPATTVVNAAKLYCKATVKGATDYDGGQREMAIPVHADASTMQGYEDCRSGGGWTRPTSGMAKTRLDAWDADDGSDEEGIKTQSRKLMSDLQSLTAEELVDYMDKAVPSSDQSTSGSGANINYLWRFPNGLQVRYKPNSTAFINGPSFCIEAVTVTSGFTTGQSQIAFKVTADGEPGAKSPQEANLPGDGSVNAANYRSGNAAATHLTPRDKEEMVIKWVVGPDLEEGTPMATLLSATLDPGDGTPKYYDSADVEVTSASTLTLGDGQTFKVKYAATKRFNAKEAAVTINVKAKPPVTTETTDK